VLARLLGRWFAAFKQQQVSWRGQPVVPFMEIGITAPKEMTSEELLDNTLLLVRRLLLGGDSQRFHLRSIEYMSPATNSAYRAVEEANLDELAKFIRGTAELTITETLQGPVITKDEFDWDRTAGGYYYGSVH
jgi:hypothetical protein